VEQPAAPAPGSATPAYPDILRQAGVEGEALVSFIVDTNGRVDLASFKVIRSTHDLFAAAVRNALPRMRFIPAMVGDRKVRQLVQQPFSFAIVK
jgi:protein TonB